MSEPIKLTFTSYRDSMEMDGLKVSMERHAPKLCNYLIMSQLVIPMPRYLTHDNMGQVCITVLNNNWNLINGFIRDIYKLGIYHMVFCCWCTVEQINVGKFCSAGTIGKYIMDRKEEFGFDVEIEYGDGRVGL